MAGTRARQVTRPPTRHTMRDEATMVLVDPDPAVHVTPLLDNAELWELAGANGLVRLEAGTPLVAEGSPIDSVILIRSGDVEVYRRHQGRRMVVQILHEGDLIGLVPHLKGRAAHYSARAISAVEVVRLRPEALTWLLQTRPTLSRRLLEYMADHLERMARRVEELSGSGLRSRVTSVLLDQTGGGPGIIRLPQATLADLLGSSRSSVNRILKEMESEGLVRVRYRRVEVLDATAMRGAIR